VLNWKTNFLSLQTMNKNEAYTKILSAVNGVGKKTLPQCKRKLNNLREAYKKVRDANKRSGESLHTSPFFLIFDEVLGTRDAMAMPNLIQVNKINFIRISG